MSHFTDIRGPQKCPRRCSECPDGNHHWLTVNFPGCLEPGDDDWEEALNHPAVLEWRLGNCEDTEGVDYFQCKHCDAWHPITEDMLDDDEFEFA